MDDGLVPPFKVRFGSWLGTQGECQPGGLVPNKMNSIVLVPWKRRESTENTLDAGNGHMSKKHQKTTFQRFWFVSEADLRFQAAKSNTNAILKYLADQKKHLTWNPVYFYAGELTTSLSRDHNQRLFFRFQIIYQPRFWCLISPSKELFVATAPVTPKASPLQSYRSLAWQ